ncbi:MAG: IPT/TIG domain-containing protein [Deltaproteobacteria bacterium]|nr:IPT/TIG domain-containing protein [Deltaproteobacteria bacterium]
MRRLLVLALALHTFGCVRSAPEIPPPSEGGFITGTAVVLDPSRGELAPAAGARARVTRTGAIREAADDGFFQLARLPLGLNSIDLESKDRRAARRLRAIDLLAGGQSVDLGPVELSGRGDLEGRAIFAEGDSSEGTLVVVAGTAFRAVAGRDGEYLLAGLPEGSFELAAFAPGHTPARVEGVQVSPSERRRALELVLVEGEAPLVAVTGEASVEGRDHHEGVTVSFVAEAASEEQPPPATTDADGHYAMELPAGLYRVRFELKGFQSIELQGVAVLPEAILGLASVRLLASSEADADGDGVPNEEDSDRDNDGCLDADDAFPEDPDACADRDQDGAPDSRDLDDDGDGLLDAEETSPGVDGAITDPFDADSDRDGAPDSEDSCPEVASPRQSDQDGDGVGDECDREPVVTGFLPPRIGAGAELTVLGVGFDPRPELNIVSFGGGAVMAAREARDGRLRVIVPPSAQSGPITLFVPRGVATSSASLVILPAPELRSIHPRRAPPGATIELVGLHLLDGPSVRLGDQELAVVESTLIDQGTDLGRLTVELPTTAAPGSYRIVVTTFGGVADETIEILGAPTIVSISPEIAAPGQVVTIIGFGFSVDQTSGQLIVRFAPGLDAAPISLEDRVIRVAVPAGAVTGPLRVQHPAGEVSSAADLVIDPELPVIARLDKTLVEVGEILTIQGANFDAPPARRMIQMTIGGALVTTATISDNEIRATVPSDARPGAIVVSVSAGSQTREAQGPFPVHIVEARVAQGFRNLAGVGYSRNGDRAFAVVTDSTGSKGLTLDAETLSVLPPVGGAPLTGLGTILGFQTFPDRDLGVLSTSLGTFLVELPTFETSPCSSAVSPPFVLPVGQAQPRFVFDPYPPAGTSVAYGRPATGNGVARIEVLDGPPGSLAATCTVFGAAGPINAALPDRAPTGRLLVADPGGLHFLDTDPGSSRYGEILESHTITSAQNQLAWSPRGPSRLLGFGGSGLSQRLTSFDLSTETRAEVSPRVDAGVGVFDVTGRFAATEGADALRFVDLEREREVGRWRPPTGLVSDLGFGAAAHPTRSELLFTVTEAHGVPRAALARIRFQLAP